MKKQIIDLKESTDHFQDWCVDVAHCEDYDLRDAVNMKVITELCEKNIIQSYSWNAKDGLTFEMKGGWQDVVSY